MQHYKSSEPAYRAYISSEHGSRHTLRHKMASIRVYRGTASVFLPNRHRKQRPGDPNHSTQIQSAFVQEQNVQLHCRQRLFQHSLLRDHDSQTSQRMHIFQRVPVLFTCIPHRCCTILQDRVRTLFWQRVQSEHESHLHCVCVQSPRFSVTRAKLRVQKIQRAQFQVVHVRGTFCQLYFEWLQALPVRA